MCLASPDSEHNDEQYERIEAMHSFIHSFNRYFAITTVSGELCSGKTY